MLQFVRMENVLLCSFETFRMLFCLCLRIERTSLPPKMAREKKCSGSTFAKSIYCYKVIGHRQRHEAAEMQSEKQCCSAIFFLWSWVRYSRSYHLIIFNEAKGTRTVPKRHQCLNLLSSNTSAVAMKYFIHLRLTSSHCTNGLTMSTLRVRNVFFCT